MNIAPATPTAMAFPDLTEKLSPPRPSQAHLDLEGMNTWLHTWLDKQGLSGVADKTMIEKWRIPSLTAQFYPGCRTRSDAQLCCAWLAWHHLFDELFDHPPLSHDPDRTQEVIDGALRVTSAIRDGSPIHTVDDPYLTALFDLLTRIVPPMSRGWQSRFLEQMDAWLRAYVTETIHRLHGTVPTPETLIPFRRTCMNMWCMCALIERVSSGELSPRGMDLLTPLVYLTSDITGVINDPASWAREKARGDCHNLVISLVHHRGITERDAIQESERLVSEWAGQLAELAKTLPNDPALSGEGGSAVRWATDCCGMTRGYHDWLLETDRNDL